MMKKILATALAVCMTVSLAACSNSAQGTQGSEPAAAGTEAAGTEAASDSAAAAESTEAQEPAAEGKVTGIDDLPGKTIGVQLGTTGDIYASDYEEQGSTIERFNKGNDAVQALLQGKIDCVIIDEQPAKAFVANTTGLKILEEPFAEEDYAICISKDNADLTAKINEALAQLKEERVNKDE